MSALNELDLQSLWKELDNYVDELNKETEVLQEVWIKIAQLKSKNEKDYAAVIDKNEFQFLDPETVIGINVGGQLFEVLVNILSRDEYSILAACCRVAPPIKPDARGIFFFDRDWWLFRHIITFLKSNSLPNEIETLKELYVEASYYRLHSLQRAIENIPVSQVTNLTPQILSVLPPVLVPSETHIRRGRDNFVYESSLFRNIS